MTNSLALWLGCVILILLGIDYLFYGTEHFLFLAKKGLELIEWLAFWR